MCDRCDMLQDTLNGMLAQRAALASEAYRNRPTVAQGKAALAENEKLRRMNAILLKRNEILARRLREARQPPARPL